MKDIIELRGVSRTFGNESPPRAALQDVDFRVRKGEFVAVIGKSGSGKSTLINIIAGIDHPTAGEVWVAESRVNVMTEDALARWRGEHLGIVFQFFQMLPSVSLLDNIVLPMELARKCRPKERRQRALALLDRVGLAALADKLPALVSGGEQQRSAIARALANDPPLIVADEPTGNLDSRSAQAVFGLFQDAVREGTTVVMVTHDMDLARAVPRRIELRDGQICGDEGRGTA